MLFTNACHMYTYCNQTFFRYKFGNLTRFWSISSLLSAEPDVADRNPKRRLLSQRKNPLLPVRCLWLRRRPKLRAGAATTFRRHLRRVRSRRHERRPRILFYSPGLPELILCFFFIFCRLFLGALTERFWHEKLLVTQVAGSAYFVFNVWRVPHILFLKKKRKHGVLENAQCCISVVMTLIIFGTRNQFENDDFIFKSWGTEPGSSSVHKSKNHAFCVQLAIFSHVLWRKTRVCKLQNYSHTTSGWFFLILLFFFFFCEYKLSRVQ